MTLSPITTAIALTALTGISQAASLDNIKQDLVRIE